MFQTSLGYLFPLPIIGFGLGVLSVKTKTGAIGIFMNIFALIFLGILAAILRDGGIR
jgi:energy-converting hydrogenase Eha subunit A